MNSQKFGTFTKEQVAHNLIQKSKIWKSNTKNDFQAENKDVQLSIVLTIFPDYIVKLFITNVGGILNYIML